MGEPKPSWTQQVVSQEKKKKVQCPKSNVCNFFRDFMKYTDFFGFFGRVFMRSKPDSAGLKPVAVGFEFVVVVVVADGGGRWSRGSEIPVHQTEKQQSRTLLPPILPGGLPVHRASDEQLRTLPALRPP